MAKERQHAERIDLDSRHRLDRRMARGKSDEGARLRRVDDIVLGIVGGVIGRFVFGMLGLASWNVIGSIIVSFVGALILIWLVRQLKRA